MRVKFNVFRNGKVHVKRAMCATCIFRPGNKMHLAEGCVEAMVGAANDADTAIVCHSTLDSSENAVCRGYYNQHVNASLALRLAKGTGMVEEVE